MAKNDNLSDFLKGIADKLRSILGESGTINPQDFERKIQAVYEAGESDLSDATATERVVRSGYTFYGGPDNVKRVGTMPNKAAATYYPTGSQQTISAGQYLDGTQTVGAVKTSNLSAGNVRSGQTVNVGNEKDAKAVASVAGTYSAVSSGQKAVEAAALVSGYSGFANGGSEVKGTMADVQAVDTAKSVYVDDSNDKVYMRLTAGAHRTKAASGYPEVVADSSSFASGAGLNAGMLRKGYRKLGIVGAYTSVSSGQKAVDASHLVSGYSGFAEGGAEVKGTLPDRTDANNEAAGVKLDPYNSDHLWFGIPERAVYAKYSGTVGHLWASANAAATALKLTERKLRPGVTVAGIEGDTEGFYYSQATLLHLGSGSDYETKKVQSSCTEAWTKHATYQGFTTKAAANGYYRITAQYHNPNVTAKIYCKYGEDSYTLPATAANAVSYDNDVCYLDKGDEITVYANVKLTEGNKSAFSVCVTRLS